MMVNLDTEINNIETASRGETVRDAIISAIRKLNNAFTPPEIDDSN